jgi:Cys-tRNA(Pro)/Cys-tRNA(Cys) deacylase
MSKLHEVIAARQLPAEIIAFESALPTVELAAQAAGVAAHAIVKTLILQDGAGRYVAVVLAGDQRIDFAKVQQAVGARKLKFAPHADVLRITGYPAGGTPPFGFDQPLMTLVDRSVLEPPLVLAGGGQPELLVRMTPAALVQAAQAQVGDYAQRVGPAGSSA